MLEKCTEDVFLKEAEGKNIIIVGAGNTGKSFLCKYAGIDSNHFIVCDNDADKQQKGIEVKGKKYHVFSVNAINNYENYVVVIASNYYAEIYSQIISIFGKNIPIFVFPFIDSRSAQLDAQVKQCLSDYYYHNHMDLDKRNEFIEKEYEKFLQKEQMVLPYLPICLTTNCTLNCDKCNNLMPYFKEEGKCRDFSAAKVEQSLTYILNVVQELIFCELVGGEPFLYKDFERILTFVGSQNKIRQIVIVTNGTIVPNENILQLLKKYNVLVRISDYGLFEKIANLVITLEKYGINVRVLQDMKWNDPGDIKKRNRRDEELYFQYNKCIFSLRCKYLAEDKLYTCARIAGLYMLGKYDGPEDVLEIDDTLSEEKLKTFYLHDNGNGCDYCDLCTIDAGLEIPAAVQRGKTQIKHSEYTIIRNDYLERLKKK